MEALVFLAIAFPLVIIIGFIQMARADAEKAKREKTYREMQDGYIKENDVPDKIKIESGINRVLVDEDEELLYLSNSETEGRYEPFVIISFSAVLGSETIVDGKSETKVYGGIGRAVVGGMLAGGAGAIVGAATGKSVSEDKITSYKVQLYLDDMEEPLFVFNLINSSIAVDKNSAEYRNAVEFSNRLNAIVRIIINRNGAES